MQFTNATKGCQKLGKNWENLQKKMWKYFSKFNRAEEQLEQFCRQNSDKMQREREKRESETKKEILRTSTSSTYYVKEDQ